MRIVVPGATNRRRIGPTRWYCPISGRSVLLISSAVAVVMLLATVRAGAYCQYGNCASPITAGVETAASPGGSIPPCNSMNGGGVYFGSFAPHGGSTKLRVCVCPTARFANITGGNLVDNSGVQFLNAALSGNNTDFKISDSGCVINGSDSSQYHNSNNGTGPNGATFQYNSGSGFTNCPGNPANFCYADITFAPTEYGGSSPLAANLNFNMDCPGVAAGSPENSCFDYLPLGALVENYVSDTIKLTGYGTGYEILQPASPTANATPYQISVPTATDDPGSVKITFQAQAAATTTTKWFTPIHYEPSGLQHTYIAEPVLEFSSKGQNSTIQTFTGQGGFLNVSAMADAASECVEVPITGWLSNVPNQQPPGCPSPPGVVLVISQALNDLYLAKGLFATPQLLEQLAYTESTYQQFIMADLNPPPSVLKCHASQTYGLWPNQNYSTTNAKNGQFIGLMQVPNSEEMAFNWVSNVTMGAGIFMDKIRIAKKYSRNRVSEDKPAGLPQLTADQLEDTAVGKYKNLAYYWVPQCSTNSSLTKGNCPGGTWSWVTNPNPCTNGTNSCKSSLNVILQVNAVRAATPPCQQ